MALIGYSVILVAPVLGLVAFCSRTLHCLIF
jgi:hypothetical protein